VSKRVVEIKGARMLRATMKRAGVDLAEMSSANRKVSAIVAAATHPPVRTGRLAASVRPGATRTSALVRIGSSRVPYAGVQEFGWPARNIPAQPYATVAAEQTAPTWQGVYLAEVDRILGTIHGST
jgi:phage gpG-like protein